MDTQLLRPLSSNIVHIRSKDGNQMTDGYNSHFKFILEDPIKINNGEQINITMSSGEFPYSFYNVSTALNNNKLVIGPDTATIADGNYSIYDLRDFITNNLEDITATFDIITMKMTFINNGSSPITIKWSESTCNKLFGQGNVDQTLSAGGGARDGDYVCNMCSVHSLMVRSNLATGNVQSTTHSNSTILQKISIDQNGFSMIYLNQDDYRTTNITQQPQIDEIELKITDQNNNLIQFNNVNFELSLIFQVFEKVVDTIHGGHANDRKNIRRRFMRNIGKPIMENGVAPYIPPPQEPEGQIVESQNLNINDTHPIEGKSEIEDKTQHTILSQLLDLQK